MSEDLKTKIKEAKEKILKSKENFLRSKFANRLKAIAVAGVVTGIGGMSGNNKDVSADFDTNEIQKENLSTNPVDSIIETIQEESGVGFEENVRMLEQEGAFFIDYQKYIKTGNAAASIVYFTKSEMAERGVKLIGTSPYDVSQARETHVVLTGDSIKDKENKAASFGKTEGKFNGGYQFNEYNTQNIILWGLVQQDNQKIRNFCKKFVRSGVDIDTDSRFVKFKNAWQKSPISTLNSPTAARASGLCCVDVTKSNFGKFSKAHPDLSELLQKEYLKNVYLRSSTNYKTLCEADFLSASTAVCGYVHLPNGSEMPNILHNTELSEQEKVDEIIKQESDKDLYGRECMQKAYRNIYNNGFPELGCFREWADMTGRAELVKELQRGMERLVTQKSTSKSSADGVLYATFDNRKPDYLQQALRNKPWSY